MHPKVFLNDLWRNDLEDEVFVIMSFGKAQEPRWEEVFRPAIENEPLEGRTLQAVRVDYRKGGDSILTEIINGIAHAQLVLADISVTHSWERDGETQYERNGNVMYEVGLALASRQPVEVVLARDDGHPLLFDITSIPV